MEFGERLRELRKGANMTQLQLAHQIGVTKSIISFYELHDRNPSPEVLLKLSNVFHVSTDYLLGRERTSVIDVSGLSEKDVVLVRSLVDSLREKTNQK